MSKNIFPTDNYEAWQLEKYGNILPPTNITPAKEHEEVKEEDYEREAEWCNEQAERQMEEHWDDR